MRHWVVILSLLFVVSVGVHAEIYSYVNEDGQTVYTDSPPNGVKTTKMDVKPVNHSQVDTDLKKQSDQYFAEQAAKRQAKKEAIAQKQRDKKMKERLAKKVKKQLDSAKQIRPGDLMPNKNGGFRYTDQYKKRLAEAEKAVKDEMKKQSRREEKNRPH
ncbi:MAG: DUF4124 domain-containing protein [Cellvibrionales bacterium]|nr:DUF4124 domain-containing protein [Cellvibrionales bacterium]